MRVGVVFFGGESRNDLLAVTQALVTGIESQGLDVDIIDGDHDVNANLTRYNYLAVGAVTETVMGGKVPEKIGKFLATSGLVSGKRSFAFILKKGLRPVRTMQKLMSIMEGEGMFLKFSEILSSPEEAEAVGKRLHIKPR